MPGLGAGPTVDIDHPVTASVQQPLAPTAAPVFDTHIPFSINSLEYRSCILIFIDRREEDHCNRRK